MATCESKSDKYPKKRLSSVYLQYKEKLVLIQQPTFTFPSFNSKNKNPYLTLLLPQVINKQLLPLNIPSLSSKQVMTIPKLMR